MLQQIRTVNNPAGPFAVLCMRVNMFESNDLHVPSDVFDMTCGINVMENKHMSVFPLCTIDFGGKPK